MGPVIFAQVIELQAANLHVCVQSWCTTFPLVNTDISASGGDFGLGPAALPGIGGAGQGTSRNPRRDREFRDDGRSGQESRRKASSARSRMASQ